MFLPQVLFWIAVACFALAEAALLRSALVSSDQPARPGMPPIRRATELVWAILPAIALVLVLAFTWRAIQ